MKYLEIYSKQSKIENKIKKNMYLASTNIYGRHYDMVVLGDFFFLSFCLLLRFFCF